MDWETDLNILRNLPVRMKGNLIRIIYSVIEDHKGKDFADLEDLIRIFYSVIEEHKDKAEIDVEVTKERELKGNLIRIIYSVIKEHKGKDFADLEDLMNQLYPISKFSYRKRG